MLFSPATYPSLAVMAAASIMDAHSDSVNESGEDIFGFLPDGTQVLCKYVWDEVLEVYVATAITP